MKDKEKHTWDEGVETTPAGYGVAGELTYKCTECDGTKKEPIAALDAKDCSVAFESGYNPSRAYNGAEIVIHKAKIIRRDANGDTIVTPEDDIVLEFKKKTDETYSAEAPKNVGEYTVKVTVKGSSEWKECSTTLDFKIPPKILTLKSGKDLVFEFNNESSFAIGIDDVFDGLVPGETPIDLVVEFNGKTAGSTYKSHKLEIRGSYSPVSNYVLAEAVETKLKSLKIAPKTLTLKEGKDLVFEFDNESTKFEVNIADVFTEVPSDDVPIDLVVEFNGKNAGSTYVSHNLLIKSSNQPATNYVLAEAVKTKITSSTISKKMLYISGEYYLTPYPANYTANFRIPSGLSDNLFIEAKLKKPGEAWTVGNTYNITPSYNVEVVTPAGASKNYDAKIADSGVTVVILPNIDDPSVKEIGLGIESLVTSNDAGYLLCKSKENDLVYLNKYKIVVTKEGTSNTVPSENMTIECLYAVSGEGNYEIMYINPNGEFVYHGVKFRADSIYMKVEPNTTYKVKITEIT